jgi:hypothetical protein
MSVPHPETQTLSTPDSESRRSDGASGREISRTPETVGSNDSFTATDIAWSPLSKPCPIAVHYLLHPHEPLPERVLDALDVETLLVEHDLFPLDMTIARGALELRLRRLRRTLTRADELRRALVRDGLVHSLRAAGVHNAEQLASLTVASMTAGSAPVARRTVTVRVGRH